jgi:DsbC/DsbD-like thiol-disulfide interchange protein
MKFAVSFAVALLLVLPVFAQKVTWYEKAVKKVEATFEPAEAKPGQTVTFKLKVELHEGYLTYPLVQPDKGAAGQVNKIVFPEPGNVIFVGEAFDPKNPKVKMEQLLGINELHYYTGTLVYERKAVVSPNAKPGEVKVVLSQFLLSVCEKDNCFPSKKLTPEATFKVLEGAAVPVEKEYQSEVEKALKK